MAASSQKMKLLYLAKILHEETDEDGGLTMPQILDRLADYGIDAERKSLYKDLASLTEFGLSIEKLRTSPVQYALVNRTFSPEELQFLADAVQSSKFLTKTKADNITRSIKSLGSKKQAKNLSKRLHVEGRIRMQNESVFYSIDAIQRAMAKKKKVEFKYFHYDCAKNQVERHGGRMYCETPVQMVYSDDCYYLIVFNDKYQDFTSYRVDRMLAVHVSDQPATSNKEIKDFNITAYESRLFGMFSGEAVRATLLVKEEAMGPVIDRFGRKVEVTPAGDKKAHVYVTVTQSPTFFGWLAQFGNLIQIEKPTVLREAYFDHLQDILEAKE